MKAHDDSSVRMLLRDLGNPRALKRNPLAAPWFSAAHFVSELEAARALQSRILQIVDSLQPPPGNGRRSRVHAERRYAIVTRYDLGGEPLESIVAALGIGKSKFYYERRAAFSRIAQELRSIDVVSSAADNAERYATKLAEAGQISLAISSFRKLIREARSPKARIALLSKLVRVLCDGGRIQEARLVLNELAGVAAKIRPNEFFDALIRAQLDLAKSQLLWYDGDSSEAVSLAEKSLELLSRYRGSSDESADVTFAANATWLGSMLTHRGEIDLAIETMTHALRHIERGGAPASAARIALLPNLANAQALSVRHVGMAHRTNREALYGAAADCSLQTLCRAHINQTMLDCWTGRRVSALAHARQAQDIAQLVCGPMEQDQVLLLLARAEGLNGYSRRALQRVAETRLGLAEDSYLWTFSQIVEAEIFNALGRHALALKVATIAVESFRRSNEWGLGDALRLQAETYEFLDRKLEAMNIISAVIPMLEELGHPYSLARGYECSARLTKNRSHSAAASDLMETLSS